jgi:chromosome segregation ATPase
MANDLEYSGKWRDTIEKRLGTLETRVGEEAGLRAAMDEDLTRLHVTRDMLQSLHDTQSDHTRRLTKLEDGQQRLENGQQELKEKLQEVHVGVQLIVSKLDRVTGED